MKNKNSYIIHSIDSIGSDVISLWIKAEDICRKAIPGQFVAVYTNSQSELLPRPISICDVDLEHNLLRLVFRVVGKGTKEFSCMKAGDLLDIIGPLGNGYEEVLENISRYSGKNIAVVGGGIGIPPMLLLAKHISKAKIFLGYRDELFLEKEFEQYGETYIAMEDGSVGTKGNVIDAMNAQEFKIDVIMACGPLPMLRGIKSYADRLGIEAWISLEEHMACGIGACLACVCQSEEIDSHSMVKNKRICKDGPIFRTTEVNFS